MPIEDIETPVNHQQIADEILAAVQAATQRIPGFTFVPVGQRRRVVVWANLPVPFLNATAAALDASESLRNITGLTGAVMRDAIAFRNAYQALADQLALHAVGLRHTVAAKLGAIGNAALRAYEFVKAMNRESDSELMVPHVNDMRRTLGKSRPSVAREDDTTVKPGPGPVPPVKAA